MNQQTPVIKLFRADGSWMAQFVDDADVLAAFGTDTIPTAYTDRSDARVVTQAIAARNPGHIVVTQ